MRKFDDLLVFVAVVERQSFIGAARQLGLPAGTVSRKIQELEARLGITLLQRTTRRIAVTEVGREVYEAAARGFTAIEEAESVAIQRHDKPSGTLRICAPYALTHLALSPMIPIFRARHPEVRLEFLITNQALDLVENQCDLAIRIGSQPDSSYVIRPLTRVNYRLVATPAYLEKHGRPKRPADLLEHQMAGLLWPSATGPVGATPSQWSFTKGNKQEDLTFTFAIAASEPMILVDFAHQSAGIAIVVETLVRSDIEAGLLEIVLPDWTLPLQLELSLLYRRRATMDSKVRVFIEFLMQILRARTSVTAVGVETGTQKGEA